MDGEVLDLGNMEDPAREWIDLVTAYKVKSLEGVREILGVAKTSKWTHELWNEATDLGWESEDGKAEFD